MLPTKLFTLTADGPCFRFIEDCITTFGKDSGSQNITRAIIKLCKLLVIFIV
jgi:hypothetical protein